jgi:hypothetical protein
MNAPMRTPQVPTLHEELHGLLWALSGQARVAQVLLDLNDSTSLALARRRLVQYMDAINIKVDDLFRAEDEHFQAEEVPHARGT